MQKQLPTRTADDQACDFVRPISWALSPFVVLLLLHQVACATVALQPDTPTEAPRQADSGEPQQDERKSQPDERPRSKPPEDEENSWVNRILAAPEYAWAGFTYPFKKLAIAYERHDLLNRALDVFLNDERTAGVFPKFAIGGTLSSGIGFTAFDNNLFRQGKEARLSYILATRDNQAGELSFRDPSLFGSQWFLETNAFWLNFDESHFPPGGNRAREQDETNFGLRQLAWDLKLGRKLAGDFSAALTGRLLIADAKPSSRLPATPAAVTGNNASMTALAIEPSVSYDSRDNPFRPTRGWFAEGAFTYTDQVDRNQFRYIGYRMEVQRYIPVFHGNRVLLLRGYLAKQDSLGGGSIPFYELNLLDLNNGLRGFDRGRWQDKGALLFNAEWRFPLWQDVEGDLFLDEGQVFNLSEARTVSLLTRHLLDADEAGALAVLKILERADVTPYVPALMELMGRPGSVAKAVAIHLLAESRDKRALPLMEEAIRDSDLAIRVNAMRFVCAAKGCPEPLIEGWLASEDARVAAGAVVCALKDEGISLRARGQQVLMTLAAAEGPCGAAQRREAALALGWIQPPSSIHTDLLISLLRDADLMVAKAALRSAAQVKQPDAVPTIISALLRNEIAGEAGDTLAQYGALVLPLLEHAYADPTQPVELRRRLPRVIAAIGGADAAAWLMKQLDEPDRVARYHIVKALNKLRARETSLFFDPLQIERRLLIEIREHVHLLTMRQYPLPADSAPSSRLFRQALAERMEDNLKLLFRLLGLLFPIKDIHAAYYGVRSDDARLRDHAIEFLDSLLPATLKQSLIPLVDARSPAALLEAGISLLPTRAATLDERLAALVRGPDPWLASCALYVIAEQNVAALSEHVREAMKASDSLVRETAEVTWRRLTGSVAPS